MSDKQNRETELDDQELDDQELENQDDLADDESDDSEEVLGEKGRDALRKERKARRQAEKERNSLKRELEALRKADSKDADADTDGDADSDDISAALAAYKERIDELESRLSSRETDERRDRVAKDYGIPKEFVKHLKGDTDDELEEGAKALVDLLKSRDINTDAGERTPRKAAKVDREKLADPARWGLRR